MTNKVLAITSAFIFVAYSSLSFGEIENGKTPGSIVLRDSVRKVVYEGITGERHGFYRKLISINNSPALWVANRYKYYYTLLVNQGGIKIDCAYVNARNTYNGARVSAGKCGLNIPLREDYDEIAQKYSDEWEDSIFSFDTQAVLGSDAGKDYLLGRIGEVEIFDRYPTAISLENSSPQKIVKGPFGCFNFAEAVGFLVYLDKDKPTLQYLDVLRSEEPMRFQRMQQKDLTEIAVEKCK